MCTRQEKKRKVFWEIEKKKKKPCEIKEDSSDVALESDGKHLTPCIWLFNNQAASPWCGGVEHKGLKSCLFLQSQRGAPARRSPPTLPQPLLLHLSPSPASPSPSSSSSISLPLAGCLLRLFLLLLLCHLSSLTSFLSQPFLSSSSLLIPPVSCCSSSSTPLYLSLPLHLFVSWQPCWEK